MLLETILPWRKVHHHRAQVPLALNIDRTLDHLPDDGVLVKVGNDTRVDPEDFGDVAGQTEARRDRVWHAPDADDPVLVCEFRASRKGSVAGATSKCSVSFVRPSCIVDCLVRGRCVFARPRRAKPPGENLWKK